MQLEMLGWDGALVRLLASLVCGGIIGFERERHGRAAGLRTTILVCLGAAMAMILSQYLFQESNPPGGNWRPDPARLAAGILTGMGFLGAGAIIREGNMIRGVTTAAALWFVTIMGLAFGSGHLLLGFVGWGIAMVILFILPRLESRISNDWYGSIVLVLQLNDVSDLQIRQRIESHGLTVKDVDLEYDLQHRQRTLRCTIKYKRGGVFTASSAAMADLMTIPGVLQVKWA